MRTHAATALLFLALSVLMTWPLARCLDRCVAYPGDPYINAWILDWDWWATFHRPLSLFHANAFHPARYSLAFSENIYGIALSLFPLRAAGVAPLTAYNIAMLAGFAFTGFGAYVLGRQITGSWLAGVAAGTAYAFLPFRFTHLSHVQHIWSGWLPLLIAAVIHYARRPSWQRAALFGAAFLMNGLTNVHWLLFGALAIAVTIPIVVRDPRRWLALGAAVIVALVLLVPFLYSYWAAAKIHGAERSWHDTMGYSAQPRDWLNPGVGNRVYRRFVDPAVDPERWLFPGVLTIIIALAGAFIPPTANRLPPTAYRSIALTWIALGFIGSLGLHAFFHRFLFTHVPGFRAIRVPARWAAIAYVGLAILVAVAVAAMQRRARWAAAVVPILFLIELRAAPIRWYDAAPRDPDVYRWLKDAPLTGAIAEVPIDEGGSEYLYLLRATRHHKPMINGISGFAPPEFAKLSTMWSQSPIGDDFVDELRRIGVELLVVHPDASNFRGDEIRAWLRRELDRGRIAFVRRFNGGISGDWVFSLCPSAPSLRPPELEAFLGGKFTYSDATIGVLDYPRSGERLRGPAQFSGWALSPLGVREVNLLFDNGGVRVPTTLQDDPGLKAGFPWYPATPRPRFVANFPRRPRRIRPDTDVQVEIIDGRGERTLLEGRWVDWE